MATKGEGFGEGLNLGFGMGEGTLWYVEWMINGHLLHGTGKSTQCSLITIWGWICVSVWLHPFATQQKGTLHCKSTLRQ